MTKLRVALLFGGRSSEHSISCATAAGVLSAIDRERFDVLPVGITPDGAYVLEQDDPTRFALDAEHLPQVADNGSRVVWPERAGERELRVREVDGSVRSLGEVDVVFPILHGPYGEDGTIQGMLELVGLPFVGSGVLASALGMHKHFSKVVLQAAGIAVAPWHAVTSESWQSAPESAIAAAERLGYPVFVKPARAGSSVGVSKVHGPDALNDALRLAFAEDTIVLIEAMVPGRELEVAVLGGTSGARARASVAGEIVLSGREFYDFEGKYLGGAGVTLECPATLSPDELAHIQAVAVRAFEAIGAEGLARVDFFWGEELVVNEINTSPGFTPISMYPRCWQESGLGYTDLITELIASAHESTHG
ncbi:MAG TPA: D-alanine--D-alanine ligase family protein [Microbacteriaceae bacterium]|nr:D-alanine--D-alanine ligase family protein [Microbacteriaceae bacterium]